jgi:hypothetical protein
MEFLQSIYQIQKKELRSTKDLSFIITQTYLIPEYHKITLRFNKKKNIMNNYNAKTSHNDLCNLSL